MSTTESDADETVTLPSDDVDEALEDMETAMQNAERSLSHDKIRPSTDRMAHAVRDATGPSSRHTPATNSRRATMPSENPAHELVEAAFDQMERTLEQDEIGREDIEECQQALVDALEHPESDIWVTLTCEGPKYQLEHHRYPDGDYSYPPPESKREALAEIVDHEITVTVS